MSFVFFVFFVSKGGLGEVVGGGDVGGVEFGYCIEKHHGKTISGVGWCAIGGGEMGDGVISTVDEGVGVYEDESVFLFGHVYK